MKQKMPSGPKGRSTNPPATTGRGGVPHVAHNQSSDKNVGNKVGHKPHDPARGTHKNGDFSQ